MRRVALALAQQPQPFANAEFMEALNTTFALQGININLTTGLYWLQPGAFLPLDAATRARYSLPTPKQLTGDAYAKIVANVYGE